MSKDTKNEVKPEIKQGATLKPPAPPEIPTPPETEIPIATKNEVKPESPEITALRAELAAKEAELMEREEALHREEEALHREEDALRDMEANLKASMVQNPVADPGVGILEEELDCPADIALGRGKNATPHQRRAYANWLKENHPGKVPLKNYRVSVRKKPGAEPREMIVKAVDEGDAKRRAFQRMGLGEKTVAVVASVERLFAA